MKIMHVITRMDKGGSAEDTLVLVLGQCLPGYEVILVKGLSEESHMTPAEAGAVATDLATAQRLGVRIITLPSLVRRISPVLDLLAFLQLFMLFRRERPDIADLHTSKAGLLGRWAAFLARVPAIVYTPHGHVFYGYFNPLITRCFILLEKVSTRITDRIIAVSDREVAEHLEQGIGTPEKFLLAYSAVDLARFMDQDVDEEAKKKELGIPANSRVVGTIGRLLPIKGPEYLLAAAVPVIASHPDTVFVLVGEGPMREELREQARTLGITDKVILTGWRPDVPEIIACFDIFALPSINEGMGKVLVEVMAAAKPVVASRVGGIIDLVREGENGFLVEPRDAAGLAAAISRLLADPALARRLGEHGRRMVYPKFDISTRLQKIKALYEDVLHGNAQPAQGNRQGISA